MTQKKNEDDKGIDNALKANQATTEQLGRFMARVEADKSTKPWQNNAFKKLQSNLDKGKALKELLGAAPTDCQSIVTLIDRLEHVSAQTFHAKLLDAMKNKMLSQPENAARYFSGLFYSGKKAPGNDVTVLLELTDATSTLEYPVKHEKIRNWINTRLLSGNSVLGSKLCASDIFGLSSEGASEKFDDVRMKNILGNVKLRSMAKDARCQYRYANAEGDSCPVGQESRSKMKGALEWLTAPNREGKTWTTVSRAAGNEEILLVYPSELPPEPPMFFSGASGVDTDNTARFEICAQNVTRALHGVMAKNPDLDIRVFLLRKMDATRRRVSSDKRCSAQHFIQAAEQWQVGSRSLPHVLVKQFTNDKDEKTTWREPETPFPMETVWALNTLWSRDGTSVSRVKGITADDGIALLVEDGIFLHPVLDRMLYAATRNLMGLALTLGQAHAQGKVFATQKNYARQTLIMPRILGLLLYKLNITNDLKSITYNTPQHSKAIAINHLPDSICLG